MAPSQPLITQHSTRKLQHQLALFFEWKPHLRYDNLSLHAPPQILLGH